MMTMRRMGALVDALCMRFLTGAQGWGEVEVRPGAAVKVTHVTMSMRERFLVRTEKRGGWVNDSKPTARDGLLPLPLPLTLPLLLLLLLLLPQASIGIPTTGTQGFPINAPIHSTGSQSSVLRCCCTATVAAKCCSRC